MKKTPVFIGLLLIAACPASALTELHSFTGLNRAIPDGDWAGLSDTRFVTSAAVTLSGLRVKLKVAGEFNGDLYAYGWIFYTPPAGHTNTDTFTYSIADTRGATAQGTVNVLIEPPVPSPNLVITDLQSGSFSIQFDAIPNKTYRIEFAPELELLQWQTLASTTADSNGFVELIDTPPAGSPRRYYRATYP